MKRLTKKQTEKLLINYRNIAIFFLIGFIGMLLVNIYDEYNYKKELDFKIQEGMDNAELNCVTLLCEEMNCQNINHVTEVQNYCKGLVYGTDFYMGLGK